MKPKTSSIRRWRAPDGERGIRFLLDLCKIHKRFVVTDKGGNRVHLQQGFERALKQMIKTHQNGGKLLFIGNGGSAAIASHQAVDYMKNGGIAAITFNDPSLLTCIGNDCGFENVFSVPMSTLAKRGDLLIAISSSGQSSDILRGVKAARTAHCSIITFSGFKPTNSLRKSGDLNFFVPDQSYGVVEVSHLSLLHAMLRELIFLNPNAQKGGY